MEKRGSYKDLYLMFPELKPHNYTGNYKCFTRKTWRNDTIDVKIVPVGLSAIFHKISIDNLNPLPYSNENLVVATKHIGGHITWTKSNNTTTELQAATVYYLSMNANYAPSSVPDVSIARLYPTGNNTGTCLIELPVSVIKNNTNATVRLIVNIHTQIITTDNTSTTFTYNGNTYNLSDYKWFLYKSDGTYYGSYKALAWRSLFSEITYV